MGEERLITRRSAVGGVLAVGSTAMTLGCLGGARAPAHAQEGMAAHAVPTETNQQPQYGFLLKVKNCVDCVGRAACGAEPDAGFVVVVKLQ